MSAFHSTGNGIGIREGSLDGSFDMTGILSAKQDSDAFAESVKFPILHNEDDSPSEKTKDGEDESEYKPGDSQKTHKEDEDVTYSSSVSAAEATHKSEGTSKSGKSHMSECNSSISTMGTSLWGRKQVMAMEYAVPVENGKEGNQNRPRALFATAASVEPAEATMDSPELATAKEDSPDPNLVE